ncbi:MAG: 50S ribosomal protein L21 [Clostridia bacterium]|jgi:large subunit ribosomal protein L21|nr:50S ribosomal protein L21 [Clostridia bacterium]
MYAIIEAGGKQYRVAEGDLLDVDRLEGEAGAQVDFDRVLALAPSEGEGGDLRLGTPLVEGARVRARIVAQLKAPKIIVFKFKPKVNYRRKTGHRQPFTRVRIEKIEG